jgi:hypothetical protein
MFAIADGCSSFGRKINMSRFERPLYLPQIIGDALATTDDADRVRRLIPAAWPLHEVQHRLRIHVEEELGMVERFLMESLARFGPMDQRQLSNFLGIDEFVVKAVTDGLQRYPTALAQTSTGWSVEAGNLERLEEGRWSEVMERDEAFLVNGLNGQLLPISLRSAPPSHWLRVNFAGGETSILDHTGAALDQAFWLASCDLPGSASVKEWVESKAPDGRALIGVPEGAFAVVGSEAKLLRTRWLLSLVEIKDSGEIRVQPPARPDISLALLKSDLARPFAEFLRRATGEGRVSLNPDLEKNVDSDIPGDWRKHIAYQASGGDLAVSILEPASIPIWFSEEAFRRPSEAGAAQDISPISRYLWNTLRYPYWWHPFSFAVRRVVPADKKTAGVLLLLRGTRELSYLAARAEGERFDLAYWWDQYQTVTASRWPKDFQDSRVSLSVLIAEARKAPETRIVEFVSEFL